jgi:hypothetical protein
MVLGAPALAEERMGQSGRDVKLVPYHRFEITSPLKREDALAAMAKHVEPVSWFRFGWPNSANDKRFEGEVTIDGFNVRRVMGYRNSFMPVVRGEVQSAGAMSRIIVTMRPFIFVIVFCAIWCVAVITGLTAGSQIWFAAVMLIFLYLMVMGGFWFEASKQEQALKEIFRAM